MPPKRTKNKAIVKTKKLTSNSPEPSSSTDENAFDRNELKRKNAEINETTKKVKIDQTENKLYDDKKK